MLGLKDVYILSSLTLTSSFPNGGLTTLFSGSSGPPVGRPKGQYKESVDPPEEERNVNVSLNDKNVRRRPRGPWGREAEAGGQQKFLKALW